MIGVLADQMPIASATDKSRAMVAREAAVLLEVPAERAAVRLAPIGHGARPASAAPGAGVAAAEVAGEGELSKSHGNGY